MFRPSASLSLSLSPVCLPQVCLPHALRPPSSLPSPPLPSPPRRPSFLSAGRAFTGRLLSLSGSSPRTLSVRRLVSRSSPAYDDDPPPSPELLFSCRTGPPRRSALWGDGKRPSMDGRTSASPTHFALLPRCPPLPSPPLPGVLPSSPPDGRSRVGFSRSPVHLLALCQSAGWSVGHPPPTTTTLPPPLNCSSLAVPVLLGGQPSGVTGNALRWMDVRPSIESDRE
ncbi:hypothetical protein MARPO_0056s0044 [Marchantia polymorpha]|uniref:Uncharacterized protein n=1 Tax=Marchantia polymorpha TaxID=3197 RepID=A0A2R6WUN6_MARPO|nr:hypothetical protein MARPO_0056s0044 [Marchantia polymorpha]|eukprot:PTQ37571.1 hypothetical protein MARPO_0056s0044 [Marchantia polymorpha]